jgi:hypothetical protein
MLEMAVSTCKYMKTMCPHGNDMTVINCILPYTMGRQKSSWNSPAEGK